MSKYQYTEHSSLESRKEFLPCLDLVVDEWVPRSGDGEEEEEEEKLRLMSKTNQIIFYTSLTVLPTNA